MTVAENYGQPSRDALLSSIEKGKKLKKANTNDRSAPLIFQGNLLSLKTFNLFL